MQGRHKVLKCLYINAHSMKNKQGNLEILVHEGKYNINCFNKQFQQKGGGGIALYVRNYYTSTEIHNTKDESFFESIWVNI